jgi:putative intracellular protease/amidase
MTSPHFLRATLAMLLASASFSAAAGSTPPVVLKGLDPVRLVSGEEKPGQPAFHSDFGRFRYLFASLENKQRFDAAPADFAVQLDGNCAMSDSMPGSPEKFAVHEGRIYLAGTETCLAAMKAEPAVYLKARVKEPRKRVAILIFPGVQIVDYTGPYEVLGQAGYDVFTVAASTDPIVTNMGMTVTPAYSFQNAPAPDIIVLPGGAVADEIAKTDPTIRWILAASPKAEYTLSVCNGAFWLANAGLLEGKEATTYYGLIELLRAKFPNVNVVNNKRYCDNGPIITTAGLSSGIDGALHVVERLDGIGKARSVAFNMEYNWQPESGYARGGLADRHLRTADNIHGRVALPDGTKTRIIDQSGGRDRWDEVWQIDGSVVTSQSIIAAASAIAPKTWKPAAADEPGQKTWSFTDETGATWAATMRVDADAKVHDRYLLAVALRKGA